MIDDLVSGIGTRSEDQIQNTWRYSCLLENLYDADSRGRRERRWFENYRVARDQRRRDLPHRNRYRKVPWRYACHDAQRLLDGVGKIRRQFRKNGFAVHATRFAGTEFRHVDRALQFAARFGDGFAFFPREQLGQLFFRFFHQPGSFCNDLPACGSGRRPPAGKSRARRLNRGSCFFPCRLSDCSQDVVSVCRVYIENGARRS